MFIYSRHLFIIFMRRFVVVFALLNLFIGLGAALAFLPRHPGVDTLWLVLGAPDLALELLPISLPFALAAAAILFLEQARRQDGFFTISLAGADPRRFQAPILLFGLAVCAAMMLFNARVLPNIYYHNRFVLTRPDRAPAALALRLATEPETLDGLDLEFDRFENGRLHQVAIMMGVRKRKVIMTAQSADLQIDPARSLFTIGLEHGRLLRINKRGLQQNLGFEKFTLSFDSRRLFGSDKRDLEALSPPRYYTNRELSRLPELIKYRERRGLMMKEKHKRRIIDAIVQIKAMRVQSALTPLLVLGLLIVSLGKGDAGRARTMFMAALCLGVLLPEQVFLEQRAERGELPGPLWALLPTFETVAALVVMEVAQRFGRFRRTGG